MAQPLVPGTLAATTINGSHGTATVAGDIVVGAGFGTTPVLALTRCNDRRGLIQVTCDATAAQATATLVYTFSDGAYSAAPAPIVNVYSDSAITDSGSVRAVATTTALTITLDVLPVDTKIYNFTYLLVE